MAPYLTLSPHKLGLSLLLKKQEYGDGSNLLELQGILGCGVKNRECEVVVQFGVL